ncbi:protein BCL9 homolog isoform X2 [Culicoides brevitarsis]|uniref:protein BCL9 homolog isoform X2 n=1 Tax=Culicoides brevitarsis TaxID=469753 RepID=UPI00307CC4C6
MQKEKRDKNKNADKTENASRKSDSSQNLSGSDSNISVKEEISDANKQDGTSSIKKEPEDRKSTTPVKMEPNSASAADKKETMEPAIKSEVKQEDMTPPNSGNPTMIKEESSTETSQSDPGSNFGQANSANNGSGTPQNQQQQPGQAGNAQNSNSKQCNNAEYMQQQSQIFVFSTMLANKGAEAVLHGQFQSIIAYHCAQPGTKKFLEKHPLKLAQFNRQNPNQFMANMSAAKQKQMMRGNGNLMMMNPGGQGVNNNNMTGFKPNSNMNISASNNQMQQSQMGNPQMQNPQQQQNNSSFLTPSMDDILSGAGDADIGAWDQSLDSLAQNGDTANLLGDSTNLDPDHFLGGANDNHAPGPDGMPPMSPNFIGGPQNSTVGLQGVKIPDENLTPQQRAHREEQLAKVRAMQKMFFGGPEHGGQMGGGPDCLQQQQMNQMGGAPGPGGPPDSCMKMGGMQGGMMGNPMMNPNMQNCPTGPPMGQIRGMNPMFRQQQQQQMGSNMMGGPNMMGGDGMMGDMNCGGMGNMDNAGMMGGHMSGGSMVMGMNKPPNMPPNMQGPQGMQAQMEWNKMQQQQQQQQQQNPGGQPPPGGFNKKMGGPPPPYQGRSSSVPLTGNLQSPNPGSPSNPLSLPAASPRNLPHQSPSHGSPAVHRMNQSNPSTPLSGSAHMSPAPASMKDTSDSGTTVNNEGQELTIQKQPNTGVKESPSSDKKNSGATTPSYPTTPGANPGSNQNASGQPNFPIPSSPASGGVQTPNSGNNNDKNPNKVNSSPMRQVSDGNNSGQNTPQHPGGDPFATNSPSQCQGPSSNNPGNPNCPPTSQFPGTRADNVPLNPSQPPTKIAPFDPLGALAGMTGSIGMNANPAMMGGPPGGFNPAMGGPDGMGGMEGMGPGMGMGPMDGMNPMNNQFNNMGPMMGGPPRPGFPGGMNPGMARMMGRPPMGAGMYNGNPNVQVKQTAPNTIQYLPSRPQMGAQNPRGPPNLEFLQRYGGPMNNMNSMDMPPQRMPGGMYGPGGNMDSIGGPNGDPMSGAMDPSGMPPGMNPNPMMMNQPGMMRGMRPRMPMGNGPPFPNSNMPFGPGGKGPGDPTQPLPPSMQGMNPGGMPPNFKGGYPGGGGNPAGGPGNGPPNTNDPNYAQQYHNFQQQLYATNTRGQLSQQSFFAPK